MIKKLSKKNHFNMKNININPFTVIFLLFLFGCEDIEVIPAEQDNNSSPVPFLFSGVSFEESDSEVFIVATCPLGIVKNRSIRVSGTMRNNEGEIVAPEEIIINDVDVLERSDLLNNAPEGSFSVLYAKLIEQENWERLNSAFGNSIPMVIALSGDSGGIEVSHDLPTPMEFTILQGGIKLGRENREVATDKPLTIEWRPVGDAVSSLNPTTYVGASVVYHVGANVGNEGLPTENVIIYDIKLESAGSITFTPEELSSLPIGGTVTIYVGSALQGTYETNGSSPSSISVSSILYEFSREMMVTTE